MKCAMCPANRKREPQHFINNATGSIGVCREHYVKFFVEDALRRNEERPEHPDRVLRGRAVFTPDTESV